MPLNSTEKHHFAQLYNVSGYSHDKWLHYLTTPVNPTRIIVRGEVHVSPPTLSDSEVYTAIYARAHLKQPDLVCAVTTSGGCSKAFSDLTQLSKWVATHKDWKSRFQMRGSKNGTTKRATTSSLISTFHKDFEDLLMRYDYDCVTIDRVEYLIFDVEHDNKCLFHTLEGVFYPVYTSTRCPDFKAIQFYRSCGGGLKLMLELQFPGVTSMTRRAALLESSTNER